MKAYYLFRKNKLPQELNKEIEPELVEVKNKQTKEEALTYAYNVITTKYHGGKTLTLTKFFDIFSSGVEDLWNRSGFLHCTNQNYLLSLLLVKSGHFNEEDIKPKWTLLWGFSPHQYLQVKVAGNKVVAVDAWSASYGIKLGEHAKWFKVGSRRRTM